MVSVRTNQDAACCHDPKNSVRDIEISFPSRWLGEVIGQLRGGSEATPCPGRLALTPDPTGAAGPE